MAVVEIFLCIIYAASLCIWCVQWTYHIGANIYGKLILHRKTKLSSSGNLPGISILKPLSGVDPNLEENLESYFTSDYPKYELLFCIEHQNDEAIPLVRSLMTKYPQIDAQLFIGGRYVGINPKINNMITGYEAAKYGLLLISDAGIKTKSDTMLSMLETMKPNVGLVHQMPYCLDRPGFAASLEKVYFGTFHGKCYLFNEVVGVNCATGMSCLFRKNILDDAGGLEAFSHYLAEDFHLTRVVMERGYKCRICPQLAQQNSGTTSVKAFQERMMRWVKLRFSLMPYMVLLEPVSECLMQGFLVSCAVKYFFGWNPFITFIMHFLPWLVLDYIMMTTIEGGPLALSKWDFLCAWLFRETNAFYLWAKAISSPLVWWRSKEYKLGWHGIAEVAKKTHQ